MSTPTPRPYQPSFQQQQHQRRFNNPPGHQQNYTSKQQQQQQDYDQNKRVRKAIQRRTVDYNSVIIRHLELRSTTRTWRDHVALQPDPNFIVDIHPPISYPTNPSTCVTTKFVHTSTNKVRCPINAVQWTPDGRRLITGASSGEFTLWNGLTFNFETILQAHDKAVRTMIWSHNDTWLITGDDSGLIKYWQSNMNNLKVVQAHKETVRDLSFSPTDAKYASCSDDGTIKIWGFADGVEERTLTGHGWDVKCIDWHPSKALLASGSKDNLVKLWDPKTGKALSTLHGHKNTILGIEWNKNGNWLVTASRDQLLRVYDIRTMREMQSFRGHKKDVQSVKWHPFQESLFVSGGSDGSMNFWNVGTEHAIGGMEGAHESSVFALDWHPMGHILVSGSNDHTTRFWTRNRPGDAMTDRVAFTTRSGGDGMYGRYEDDEQDAGGESEAEVDEWADAAAAASGGAGGMMGGMLPGLGDLDVTGFSGGRVPLQSQSSQQYQQSQQQSNKRRRDEDGRFHHHHHHTGPVRHHHHHQHNTANFAPPPSHQQQQQQQQRRSQPSRPPPSSQPSNHDTQQLLSQLAAQGFPLNPGLVQALSKNA
ncbi:WD40-repeat-containing domain protein [Phlyctochytrium arcticum]|nr:WD40-repeat-containing domain protein [Phlyctochytrium arcticum]